MHPLIHEATHSPHKPLGSRYSVHAVVPRHHYGDMSAAPGIDPSGRYPQHISAVPWAVSTLSVSYSFIDPMLSGCVTSDIRSLRHPYTLPRIDHLRPRIDHAFRMRKPHQSIRRRNTGQTVTPLLPGKHPPVLAAPVMVRSAGGVLISAIAKFLSIPGASALKLTLSSISPVPCSGSGMTCDPVTSGVMGRRTGESSADVCEPQPRWCRSGRVKPKRGSLGIPESSPRIHQRPHYPL
jgi:hypothetical protein